MLGFVLFLVVISKVKRYLINKLKYTYTPRVCYSVHKNLVVSSNIIDYCTESVVEGGWGASEIYFLTPRTGL